MAADEVYLEMMIYNKRNELQNAAFEKQKEIDDQKNGIIRRKFK